MKDKIVKNCHSSRLPWEAAALTVWEPLHYATRSLSYMLKRNWHLA